LPKGARRALESAMNSESHDEARAFDERCAERATTAAAVA
jgi:hypothetical protein